MSDLTLKARIFILSIISIGVGLSVFNLFNIDWQNYWLLILTAIAAVAQVCKVEGATHKSSYNLGWVVYGFSFLILGGPATLFVILIAHLIDWIWHKYPWYIQMYNIAAFAITISATSLLYNWILTLHLSSGVLTTLAVLVALASFTLLNHLLIGLVIWFARGQSLQQSGVFGLLTVIIDFTLIALGAVAALIWTINPSAVILVLIPLYLIYRTLQVPSLQRQTKIDPKTKLYNAVYFTDALKKENDRALRFDRPLTVAIGDLDLMRDINNTYGHLAGDAVLVRVAEVLQEQFYEYDLVARFGGEEFAILMPETTPEEAFPRVEAVREAIAATEIEVPTCATPVRASISFGIAARNGQVTPDEILHNADLALYRSKLVGRNVTSLFTPEKNAELISKSLQGDSGQMAAVKDHRSSTAQPILRVKAHDEKPGVTTVSHEPRSRSPYVGKSLTWWRVNGYIS